MRSKKKNNLKLSCNQFLKWAAFQNLHKSQYLLKLNNLHKKLTSKRELKFLILIYINNNKLIPSQLPKFNFQNNHRNIIPYQQEDLKLLRLFQMLLNKDKLCILSCKSLKRHLVILNRSVHPTRLKGRNLLVWGSSHLLIKVERDLILKRLHNL